VITDYDQQGIYKDVEYPLPPATKTNKRWNADTTIINKLIKSG